MTKSWWAGYEEGRKPSTEEPRKVIPPNHLSDKQKWDWATGFIKGDKETGPPIPAKEATMRMQLTTGLHIRDEIAKAEIYKSKVFTSLSEGDQETFEKLIEKAFDEADALWRKQFVPSNADIDKVTLG